jgi:hypothetical protein
MKDKNIKSYNLEKLRRFGIIVKYFSLLGGHDESCR